jgi:hypothetical protein
VRHRLCWGSSGRSGRPTIGSRCTCPRG